MITFIVYYGWFCLALFAILGVFLAKVYGIPRHWYYELAAAAFLLFIFLR